MNENIDLTKILKDCPIGWEFYSSIHGDVTFRGIETDSECPVKFFYSVKNDSKKYGSVTEKGLYAPYYYGECTLFPSREQRDWSKFTDPWYKKERFDPKTLKPFDKVLCWNGDDCVWECDFFSYYKEDRLHPCVCVNGSYIGVIPYNDKTQKFAGTSKIAPEYYRYWEE